MKMVTLSVVDLYLRVSSASLNAFEIGVNAGAYVTRVLKFTGNKPGDPWCASQVSDWGHKALGALWPVPITAGVMVIAEWAKLRKCRYAPAKEGVGLPQVGDLYLLWYPEKKRFAHVGVIIAVDASNPLHVMCRDGNTSDPKNTDPEKQREGWQVGEKWRTLTTNDRLVRWADVID